MAIGFWQLVVIVYVLFFAVGPRRVVRWVRWGQTTSDRLRGRPRREQRSSGWLRAIELFEYSSQVGWACLILGAGIAMLTLAQTGWPLWKGLALAVSMLLLLLAPWLI
jgi:hypothetical protein